MYKLGCALRGRYDDFLGSYYHPKDVYARSSDISRTKMSLMLVLAGLYPPSAVQSFRDGLNWMPVPFVTVPKELDFLLLMFDKPRYTRKLHAHQTASAKKSSPVALKVKEFFRDTDVHVFKTESSHSAALLCYNVLNTHKAAKCQLPEWYSDDIFDSLRETVIEKLDTMSGTLELKKMLIGPLIRKFLENINVYDEMTDPRKIYLYSCHDFNVAAFLRAHEVEDMKYPDFGSAVVVEKLRDPQGKLHVRMLAWTGQDDDFFAVKLGKCGEICPIEDYLKIVENTVPSDEELDEIYKDCIVDVKKIDLNHV
ncbi:venom acid phosphatase Acph-1-like isoform X2 [Copidosoma floridanum]|uniref:venom acid phosphatase Acph-1-like isoform X2 n=1 Tax=Copidosoma floridanum TaxID=29053 RepID=UPI000C6FBBFD|nr:venom acid phosphatase Acph-1-like isoform X2 [Copidosoma floridanum]